jgi:hypothetical protein
MMYAALDWMLRVEDDDRMVSSLTDMLIHNLGT